MKDAITLLYFLSLGASGLYVYSPWIRPYTIVGFFLLTLFSLRVIQNPLDPSIKHHVNTVDILIFMTMPLGILSTIGSLYPKTINYILAYSFTFLAFYYLPRLFFKPITRSLIRIVHVSILIIVIISLLLYSIQVLHGVNYLNYLSLVKPLNESLTTLLSYRIQRLFGLSEEPANYAHYLITIGPLALFQAYLQRSRLIAISLPLILMSLILTASASAIASLLLALLVLSTLKLILYLYKLSIPRTSLLIALLSSLFIGIFVSSLLDSTLASKILDPSSNSASRYNLWQTGLAYVFPNHTLFLGNGMGSLAHTNVQSFTNWYLSFAYDAGLIATSLFLLSIFITLLRLVLSTGLLSPFLFISILSGALQYNAMSTFFNPPLWVMLAIANNYLAYPSLSRQTKCQ